MKAMILAAGRGERMRPLTDHIPKPLLTVGSRRLIEYRLIALAAANIKECVINLSYRGKQIEDFLGNGDNWGVTIAYSYEREGPLESAGGIINALPLLGNEPFVVVNADIWTDYNFQNLPQTIPSLAELVMVDNPTHNTDGDFSLQGGILYERGESMLTYSGMGVFNPDLFSGYTPGKRALRPVLLDGIREGKVHGQYFRGLWSDVGTPERLNSINDSF